jgi:hypothetical protein
MRKTALQLAAVLFMSSAPPASAQIFGPVGGEFRVNSTTAGVQGEPSVIFGGLGPDFVIVWTSPDGDGGGISGRGFDDQGTPGSEFRVNTITTGDHHAATIAGASLPNLQFHSFVVYQRDVAAGNEVFARRYSGSTPDSDVFQVGSGTSSNDLSPRAAGDSSANFVAVWNQDGTVMGQRYDSSGAELGTAFAAGTALVNTGVRVARAPGGDFLVTWISETNAITAQRYHASGAALGGSFRVNAVTGFSILDSAVSMIDSQFVVTWTLDGADPDLRARVYDSSGSTIRTEFAVSLYTTGSRSHPDVAMDGAGGFVVVWEDDGDRDGGGGVPAGSIWAHRFDAAGQPVSGEFRVNTTAAGDQLAPRVANFGGSFIVVWQGNGNAGPSEIYAQRYCANKGGDANGSGAIDIADVFYLINYLFAAGPSPAMKCDVNDDGTTDIADVFYLINFLFAGGPSPACNVLVH